MKVSDINLLLSLPEFVEAKSFWEQEFSLKETETNSMASYYFENRSRKEEHMLVVDPETAGVLNKISKGNPEAVQVLAVACLRIVMYNYTRQTGVEIGIPLSVNMAKDSTETSSQLLPVYLSIAGNMTVKDIIRLEKEKIQKVLKYQYYPLSKLNAYHAPKIAVIVEGLNSTAASGDVNFVFEKNQDSYKLKVAYNAELYSSEWIKIWSEKYLYAIKRILSNVDEKMEDIYLLEEKEKHKLLYELNATTTDYLTSRNLVELFHKSVKENPTGVGLVYQNKSYTYQELDEWTNRIASFLLDGNKIRKGDRVGILMKKTDLSILAILGILKAGGVYVAISPEYPLERIKYILNDASIGFVVSSKNHIKLLNKLQWECPAFKSFICLDTDDVYKEKEEVVLKNAYNDQKLWEYIGEKAEDEIDGGGWTSSFTGEKFSSQEMKEYQDNVLNKLGPFVNSTTRILEIGCASGITMFGVAPSAGFYYGTDLSRVIIKKNQKIAEEKGYHNIKLRALAANEIDQLEEGEFDIVVINSVAQCFDGHNYMRDVLSKAMQLMKKDGHIFLGDMMDEDKREEMLNALNEFKEKNTNNAFKVKTDFTHELFYSKKFMEDLVEEFEDIHGVSVSGKTGTMENELTLYRYDAILSVRKGAKKSHVSKHKYQYSLADLPATASSSFTGKDIEPNDSVYILYTSGSTGTPKGVEIVHKNVLRLFIKTNYLDITKSDRIMNTVPLEFDPSVFEIWLAFANALPIYVVNTDLLLRAQELKSYIDDNKITQTVIVTALFATLAEQDPAVFDGLRYLFIGGEALPVKQLNKVRSYNPALNISNLYGPTENTVISTFHPITSLYRRPVPIGKAISNSTCYILDRNKKLVIQGAEGELYVGGDGVALGYINRQDLTSERFVTNPYKPEEKIYNTGDLVRLNEFDEIEFLGRVDTQVKIRGFRIELSEIENVIMKIEGVKEAKVVVKTSAQGDKSLYAYYTAEEKLDSQDVLIQLSQKLPAYMIPVGVMQLEEFPLTSNNKIDVTKLPDPTEISGNRQVEEPANDTEKLLVEVWKEVLGVPSVGVNDNFFDLGGHSLKAMKVLNRLSKNFDLKLTLLFQYPTVRSLAPHLVYKKDNLRDLLTQMKNEPLSEEGLRLKQEFMEQYMKRIDQERINVPGEVYELKNVLLTGATGYLGVHILAELLKTTDAKVYCLLRAENKDQAVKRIVDKLNYYFGSGFYTNYTSRIEPVLGDMSEPSLGLRKEEFERLSYVLDSIVNAAANVKHYGQKEDYLVNSEGVYELVKLTSSGNSKRLHHVSTCGMSFGGNILFTEFDKVERIRDENTTFYLESKLEAERVIFKAMEQGVPCTNLRIGNLVLNKETLKFQENESNSAFFMLLNSMIELQAVPEMNLKFLDFSFIDLTAQGIVKIMKERNLVNDTYHVLSHHCYSWKDLYELFVGKNFPEVRLVPLDEFYELIIDKYKDEHYREYVNHLLLHIRLLQLKEVNMICATDRTRRILEKLSLEWPELDVSASDSIVNLVKKFVYEPQ